MAKTCEYKDCNNPRWSKGMCKWHVPKQKSKVRSYKKIKPISDRKAEQLKIYRKERDSYLKEIDKCERCGIEASEIHHKNGRTNERLYDSNFFMSSCRPCHNWIHANPKEAREQGYLI